MINSMDFEWIEPMFEDWDDVSVKGVGDGFVTPGKQQQDGT
jgi:hypothetical protein